MGLFLQTLRLLSPADVTMFTPELQLEGLGATLGNSPSLLAISIRIAINYLLEMLNSLLMKGARLES